MEVWRKIHEQYYRNRTTQTKYGDTPLHPELLEGQWGVGHMLIEHGADVTTLNKDGESPLHRMLKRRRDWNLDLPGFLYQGVDSATRNKYDVYSHDLQPEGPVEVARMLIKRGAVVTARNKHGETSLELALQNNPVEVAYVLIEHGADPTAKNEDGETPLYQASKRGQVKVVQMLIERGADVTAQNKNRETPLHPASRLGKPEVARLLIEGGADVEAQNETGRLH